MWGCRTASRALVELRLDRPLNASDGPERLLERCPGHGCQPPRLDQVVGSPARPKLLDLMLHPGRGEKLERLTQSLGVLGAERPGLRRRLQSRSRRGGAHAGDQAAPAGHRLDGHEPASLDVEYALALSAGMEHEVP